MKKIYILLFFLSYSVFAQVNPQSISPVSVGCKPATVPPPLPMPAKSKKQSQIKGAAGVAAVGVVGTVESIHSAFVNWQSGGFTSFSIGTGAVAGGADTQNIRWGQGLNSTDKTTYGYSFEELRLSALALGTTFTQGQNFYFHFYNGVTPTVVGPLNFTWQNLGAASNVVNVNIETSFGTNGLGGFAAWQRTNMMDFYSKIIPIIAQVYGPSSHAYTANVINDGNSAGSNTFYNGPNWIATQYTADPSGKMTQPRLMVHELIHAWRDNVCLSSSNVWHYDSALSGFEESMADCVAEIVMDKFIETYPSYYSGSSNYLSRHWSNEPGYPFDWDYDFQNHSQLTTTNFWSSDQGMGAHWERYGAGSAAMYKMYVEDNNFFKNFNAEYYRRLNADHTLTTSRALMVDICKTVIAKVEGKPTETWINNQRILDCKVTPGKKVHMLSFQGAGGWQYMGHDNRIHLYETQNLPGGNEWSWDSYSGGTLIGRWYHQLNNEPGKIDIVNYTTGATTTQNFRNNDSGYAGPDQGACPAANANGNSPPSSCFPGGIDGHGIYTTSADPAITGGGINAGTWFKNLKKADNVTPLNADRFIWKLQTTGLYIYNIEFQARGETVKGKYYRLHGNDFIGKDGIYAGVRNNADTKVSGKMYVEQKNTVMPVLGEGEEPAIPIDNGTLIASRAWASVLETLPQFQGGSPSTRYSKPGKVHAIYVDDDCNKPQKIGFRNVGYGSNSSGMQMFLFNVDDFDEIKYKETMPDLVCEGYKAEFSVTYDADADLLPVLKQYLDTDSRIKYQWKKDGRDIPGETKNTYTITAAAPTDSGVYTLEINSYGCIITRTKTLVVTPNVVLTPTVGGPISICANGTINLDVNGILPPGTTYDWSGPNGYTNTTKNPSITNAQVVDVGLYTVTCTVKDCDGITDIIKTAQIQVNVNPILKPVISCGTPTSNSVTFDWSAVLGATDYTVSYQINGNPVVNMGAIGNLLTYTVSSLNASDNVTISITPTGASGTCFAVDTKTCQASSIAPCTIPVANVISATATISCAIPTVTLDGAGSTTGTGITYQWTTTDGTIASDATTLSPVVSAAGTYNLVVTNAEGSGCNSTTATVIVSGNTTLPVVAPITGGSATVCEGSSTPAFANATTAGVWSITNGTGTATINASGVVSGLTAGNVAVEYTVTTLGCSTKVTSPLTINTLPVVAAITGGSATVCEGSSTPAFANATATGIWSITNGTGTATVNASGVVSGLTAGNVTLEYTVTTLGCSTKVTTSLTINALSVVAAITGGSATVCEGSSTPAFANATAAGVWSIANGTGTATINASGVVSGLTAGNVTVEYTVATLGCSTKVTSPLTINALPVVAAITGGSATVCEGSSTPAFANATAAGVWSITNGTGTATINASGVVSGLTAGNVTVEYMVTTFGCSTKVTSPLTINALPVAPQLSSVSTICSGDDAVFTITGTPGNKVTYDGAVSGTVTIQPNGEATVGVIGVISDTTLRLTKVSDGTCDLIMSRNTKTVYVQVKPNAGTDGKLTICSGTNPTNAQLFAQLRGNPDAGGTWEKVVNIDQTVTYTYTVNAKAPCAVATKSKVTVSTQALPNAGVDGVLTICAGTSPTDQQLFNHLGGNPDIGGKWSNVGNVYTYKVKGESPCNSYATATVTVITQAKANAGISGVLTICSGTTPTNTQLFAQLAGGPDTGGTWNKSNANEYVYTVLSTGVCTEPVTAKVTVTEINTIAKAGADKEITCKSSSVTLNGVDSSTTGYTYLWTGGTIVSGATTLTPTVDAAGIYTLTVTNTALGCKQSDSVVVTNNTVIPIADAGNTGVITCLSPVVKLDGTGSTNGADMIYTWTGGKIATGTNSLTPTVSTIGMYTLKVENTATGCSSTDTVEVIQDIEMPDFSITDLGSNQFEVVPSGGVGPYEYSLNNANEYTTNPNIKIYSSGNYTIYVKDSKGCFTSESKYLDYLGIEFPKFFSPEGDGTNDHWYPTRIEDYPNLEVLIYDRYQRLIVRFKGNNELGWDGTYQGKPLPSGDYWYVIKTNNDNDKRELVGGMTLFR